MKSTGFSFIELIAALAIMAALLLIAVPSAKLASQRHREAELRTALTEIRGAIDKYKQATEQRRIPLKVGESGYPPNLTVLVEGVADAVNPQDRKLYFLRRLPPDPFYTGTATAPEATWGLRSYESPPDDPKAGDDVFDVFSQSRQAGLNGIPYSQW